MNPALAAWIKRQEEDKRKHEAYMAKKNAFEDAIYIEMAEVLITIELQEKTAVLLHSFLRHKREGKNFTPGQRSAITTIFYRYFAEDSSA